MPEIATGPSSRCTGRCPLPMPLTFSIGIPLRDSERNMFCGSIVSTTDPKLAQNLRIRALEGIMAHWIFENGQTIGPLKVSEVLDRATPSTSVSHGDRWVRLDQHPDFAAPPPPHAVPPPSAQTRYSEQLSSPANASNTPEPEPQLIPCENYET